MDVNKVKQVVPEERILDFDGLFLKQNLQEAAKKLGRNFIFTNYVTDLNDTIATIDKNGNFQVAREVKNKWDWQLFQELLAQSDAVISAKGYLQRFEKMGSAAQNIFNQFEKGGKFEYLGNWRLENGFKQRSPDVIILSRSLDFKIPEQLSEQGRKVLIYTTYEQSKSKEAKSIRKIGADVIGAGESGVEGKLLYKDLNKRGYNVVKMATGPAVMKILLDANILDRIYITQVQKEIKRPSDEVQTIMKDKKISDLKQFKLTEKYIQNGITTDDGQENLTQHLLRYDNT